MRFFLGLIATLLFSVPAFAHTGVGATHGFAHGFMHPVGGIDHVLAMVTVGLLAFHLGGRAMWLVPLSFVGMMAVGGVLGLSGIALPFVELGIGLSIVVIGGAVASGRPFPVAAAMALTGFFAIFHGYAHGAEMPEDASGLTYALGFMLATALLHATGLGLGFGIARTAREHGSFVARASGGAVALAGVAVLGGVI